MAENLDDIDKFENEIKLNVEEREKLRDFLKDKLEVLIKLKDKEEKSSEIDWDNKKIKFTIKTSVHIPYIVSIYSIFDNISKNFKKYIYPVFYLYDNKIILAFGKNTDTNFKEIKVVWDKRIDNIAMKIMEYFSTESNDKLNIIKNINIYNVYEIENKSLSEELLDSIVDSFIKILKYYISYIDIYQKYKEKISNINEINKKDVKEVLEYYLSTKILPDEQTKCGEDIKNYDKEFFEFLEAIQKFDIDFSFPLNTILYGTSRIEKIYNIIIYSVYIIERKLENYIEILEKFKQYVRRGEIEFIPSNKPYIYKDFKKTCEKVENDKNNNYILIIEDINKRDSIKIFGKDYFELEKRLYNEEESKIPKNLYILGTVSTIIYTDTLFNLEFFNRFKSIEMLFKDEIIKNIGKIDEEIKNLLDVKEEVDNFKFSLNTILYGPPGTGKTYNSIFYSVGIIKKDKSIIDMIKDKTKNIGNIVKEEIFNNFNYLKEQGQIEFVTFHQSYSYEDFVEGIRPTLEKNIGQGKNKNKILEKENNGNGTKKELKYTLYSGIFKNICERAESNLDKNYVLIIDEINRGNISKIFGELITLLEPSKRLGEIEELKIRLPYSGEEFGVPKNLYILGTMNTADRSIALLDIALRRRFNFIEMPPKYNLLKTINCKEGEINLQDLLEAINTRIEFLLDKDHLIGHSYFINIETFEDLKEVFKNSIMPLLQEYFYDDFEKIKFILNGEETNFIIDKKEELNSNYISKDLLKNLPKLFQNKTVYEINEKAFEEYENYRNIYHKETRN